MKKLVFSIIICISSFIIHTNNVIASPYDRSSLPSSGYSVTTNNLSLVSSNIYEDNYSITFDTSQNTGFIYFNFNNNIDTTNYDSLIFNFNTMDFYQEQYVCTYETSSVSSNMPIDFTTTYSDGSTSTSQGDITWGTYTSRYCNTYTNSHFYSSIKVLAMTSTGNSYNCQISGDNKTYYLTCPVVNGDEFKYISGLRFYFFSNNIVGRSRVLLSRAYLKHIDNNAIVNNISNNTNEIKNDIKDSSIDNNNATGTISNLSSQLASDNTISSLLLLPINFINVLIDGLGGQCVPYDLGELWGTHIIMPCVDLYQSFGAIWYLVDTGLSALIIFKMSKYFIRLFNKLTNLKDGGLEEAYS